MFLTIYMHLYSIIETVLYMFYEAISNKSVYSLQIGRLLGLGLAIPRVLLDFSLKTEVTQWKTLI